MTTKNSENLEEEMNIGQLLKDLWRFKLLIIASTILCGLIAIYLALTTPEVYKATATLMPAEESNRGSGLGAQASTLGMLVGLDIGSQEKDKFRTALQLLNSRFFINEFVEKYDLKPYLFAVKEWDKESATVEINEAIYDPKTDTWNRELKGFQKPEPNADEVFKYFTDNLLTVNSNNTSGFVTLELTYIHPELAADWLNKLIEELNSYMRMRDITAAEESIQFIQREVQRTNIASIQSVFNNMVEQQLHIIMLAKTKPDYVFTVIDPAIPPIFRDSPNRRLIVILGVIVGGFLGVFISLMVMFVQNFRRQLKSI